MAELLALLAQSLALAFAAPGNLELGERAHHIKEQCRHWGFVAGKGQFFFDEPDADLPLSEFPNCLSQIHQVAPKTIH